MIGSWILKIFVRRSLTSLGTLRSNEEAGSIWSSLVSKAKEALPVAADKESIEKCL
jgi:hypothetical protein